MASVEDSIDIKAPIDVVFTAVTDPRRTLEWNPSIISVSDVTGVPIGVGSAWRQSANVAGRTVNLVCRIAHFDIPYEGVLEVTGDQQGRVVTRCRQMEACTRLSQTIEFVPPGGLMGRMAMGVIQPALKRELSKTLLRQREILEREAKDGYGTS